MGWATKEQEREYNRLYRLRNIEKLRQFDRDRWQNNTQRRLDHKKSSKKYYDKHKDSIHFKQKRSKSAKTYKKNNRSFYTHLQSLRRANQLKATPKWLTPLHLEQIQEFYDLCPEGYHVDHIHPLNGKNLCGLHVPWNLQFLPAEENIRKSNNCFF